MNARDFYLYLLLPFLAGLVVVALVAAPLGIYLGLYGSDYLSTLIKVVLPYILGWCGFLAILLITDKMLESA